MTLEDLRREYFENRLGRAVGGRFAKERKELLDLLGYPPDPNNVPPEFWTNGGAAMESSVRPILQDIAVESAIALQEGVIGSIVLDWSLINQVAADWAKQYGFDLVSGINETSRRALQQAIPQFFEEGLTRGQLEAELMKIYAPQRAEMIAVTEVTRASYEGDRLVVDEIKRTANVKMWPTWLTNRDDLVCAICGPLDNIPATRESGGVFYWDHPTLGGTYTGPPAHPRCRCDVQYEILDMDK